MSYASSQASTAKETQSDRLKSYEATNNSTSRFLQLLEQISRRAEDAEMLQDGHWPETHSAASDEATMLSYEQALRATARYPVRGEDSVPTPEPDWQPQPAHAPKREKTEVRVHAPVKAHVSRPPVLVKSKPVLTKAKRTDALIERPNPRRITLSFRSTENEAELVRMRAAEAGLSTSAYLRACILEAEELRTQVRMAMAAVKQAQQVQTRQVHAPSLAAPAATHTPPQAQEHRGLFFRFFGKRG